MSYLDKIKPVESFDPEGAGYDYTNAIESGDGPDKTGHWGSLDRRTGLVLKGRNHPTWDKMVDAETEIGNTIVRADDGRYYSVKLPDYLKKVSRMPDTEDHFQKDYDFAVKSKLPLGFFGSLRREWATPRGIAAKLPFFGGFYKFAESSEAASAARRLSEKWDYNRPLGYKNQRDEIALGRLTMEDIQNDPYALAIYADEAYDKKVVSEYLKYVSTEQTLMGKIASGVSVLPTWMVEFAATGGLYSLGDDAAQKAGEKILGEYAKSKAGQLALKTAGWAAGSATRTVALTPKVAGEAAERQLQSVLGMREEDGWATSALISWGDVYIEALSESAGGALTAAGGALMNKLPFGSKLTGALEKAWMAATGGEQGEFLRKLASKGGYSNILGEIGEERLGTILRAITDVDDFGAGPDANMIDRLKYGMIQDFENIGVELAVLSVPMIGQGLLSQFTPKPVFDYQFDQAEAPVSQEVINEVLPISSSPSSSQAAAENPPAAPAGEPMAQTPPKSESTTTQEKEKAAPKPVTIENANTDKEVEQIVEQIVYNTFSLEQSSARKADIQEDRAFLGLDGLPSPERKSFQQTLSEAKRKDIPGRAHLLATEIINQPRPLDAVETAGLRIKLTQIRSEYRDLKSQLAEAKDAYRIKSLASEMERLEGEFDFISDAMFKGKTELGRALAAQKITIDDKYNLKTLQARAKAKKGRELTDKEYEQLKKVAADYDLMKQQIDLMRQQIDKLNAQRFIKEGSVRRYGRMNKTERDMEFMSLVDRTKQLLDEGCYN
jgi:hypothetical protein